MPHANPWLSVTPPTLLAAAGLLLVLPPIPGGHWLGTTLLAGSALMTAAADIPTRKLSRPATGLLLLLGLSLLSIQSLDTPETGALLCLIGGLFLALRTPLAPKGYALVTVGVVGLSVTTAAHTWVWWRAKGITLSVESLAPTLAILIRLTGGSAAAASGQLWVGVSGTNAVAITPEALAWPFLALWLVALLSWMSLMTLRTSLHRIVVAAITFGIVAVGIYLIRLECVAYGSWPVEALQLTAWHLSWLVPVGMLLGRWVLKPIELTRPLSPLTARGLAPVLVASVLIISGWIAPYASALNHLTLLIDEGHGPWESTTVPFTTDTYGRHSVYNYGLLAQWLRLQHTVIATPADSPLPTDLERYQVIVIKTPAKDYTVDEIERLATYVHRGGGLLLIGDHTNLFGHTARLNAVAAPYGLSFRVDAAYAWQAPEAPYVHMPSALVGSDLLLQGLPPLTILTAASIVDRTVWGLPFVRTTALASEGPDYSHKDYFGPLQLSPDDISGPLALAVATPYGRGKVVAWGDSTIWSNFSMFHPGYPDLILRLVGYAGSPSYHRLGQWVVIAAALFLIGSLWFLKRRVGRSGVIAILAVAVPIGGLTALAFPWQPSWPHASDLVPSTTRAVSVDFAHTEVSLSIQSTRRDLREQMTYTAFYAWIVRTGILPLPAENLTQLAPHRPLILLNPVKPFTASERTAIANFVRTGGRLLVLDDTAQLRTSTAPEVLRQFGVEYRLHIEPETLYTPVPGLGAWLREGIAFAPLALALRNEMPSLSGHESSRGMITTQRLSIEGASPRAVTSQGSVILATKAFGAGSVTVFAGSHSFNQLSFGDIWGGTEPGQVRQRLYDTEFQLLEELWSDATP